MTLGTYTNSLVFFPSQIYEMGTLVSAFIPEGARSVFTGSSNAECKENHFLLFFRQVKKLSHACSTLLLYDLKKRSTWGDAEHTESWSFCSRHPDITRDP